jgi:murein L,D-transpeptidase YcbB/YkuD
LQAASLRQALTAAASHGLDPAAFTPAGLDDLLRSSELVQRRQGEALLMRAVAAYAQALRGGRLPLDRFPANWAIRPQPYDAGTELQTALRTGSLDGWLRSLPPPYADYQALRPALARYRGLAEQGGWARLDLGATLRPGDVGPAVLALRERLRREGLGSAPLADPQAFDAVLAAAVAAFQTSRGLTADAVVGPLTLAALNVPVEARLAAIEASLERWRWLPRMLPARRVEVNIAAAELRAVDPALGVLAMRTVVGRPADPTPMFDDLIESVVFNPPWNVPASIAAAEILPRARRDPGYLAREGFVFIGEGANRRLQQSPGSGSALGLYKFDLPNRFNVYLHDTPGRAAFTRDQRNLSHGCVRLEKPRDLAIWMLGSDPAWDAAAIDRRVATGVTTSAPVAMPTPVYLFYWTAFTSDEGVLNFRSDVYGWDDRLLRMIAGSR